MHWWDHAQHGISKALKARQDEGSGREPVALLRNHCLQPLRELAAEAVDVVLLKGISIS